MTRVTLVPREVNTRGHVYDVLLNREIIVSGSNDPEHAAARELVKRGIVGSFQTTKEDGTPRMTFRSIEKTAGMRVVERSAGGLHLEKHREHPHAVPC